MVESASSAKKNLVLLHGWGLNQGVWQGIAPKLAEHFVLTTPDLPGFGLNRNYPQAYQLDEVLDQIADQLPEHSIVCGWSLGGLLAMGLAERHPNKVAQLGLIAASPCFLATHTWPGMRSEVMTQFATALSANLEQTIQRFLAIQAMGSEYARQDIQMLRAALANYPAPEQQAVALALKLLANTDLRETFAQLRIPIAGCFGRLDSLVPATILPLLQAMQPTASFELLPKASHAPFISHPEAFIAWLKQAFV